AVLLAHATADLRPDDRALCYELTLGTLRRQLWLDKLIEHCSGRNAAQVDPPVRRALRLGLYQLRFLSRIPASAAVNESVNLAHGARLGAGASKFVNAILRRATREPDFDPATLAGDEMERVSIETSHPRWLIERWTEQLGMTETVAFARANNQPPPVAFRVNSRKAGSSEALARLLAAGVELVPSTIALDAWRVVSGTGGAALRALSDEGLIYTQDEASQLVGHVLGVAAGERVLDVCAAPGSKATHVAELAAESALVVAGDFYGHRLRVVQESGARQELGNIRMIAYDAEAALPFAGESFDRVLVDAPCTGTGTLRHNPEIRWRLRPADVADLSRRQRRILALAAPLVRRGGRLVYSTCSVEREENEAVIAALLAENSDFKPEPPDAPDGLLINDGTAARTWPHRDGADGFFIAALRRTD
ncbi:MAG: 16S rRNA (cytosine(967)-C(5))-methyltransferase RsmB, partial [Pyrinomonadaceae bacterium]